MDAQLESVLDAYAAAEPGPSRATLAEWIREYPQFANELTKFTATWQLLEWIDEAPGADAGAVGDAVAEDDRLLLRGVSAAQSAFYAARANRPPSTAQEEAKALEAEHAVEMAPLPAATAAPIASLGSALKRSGLSQDELIERAGLSDGLFRKLDRRLIDPLTIPDRVLGALASALGCDVAAVAAYTRLAAGFGVGAQHRATRTPTLPQQREDFFEAVRQDLAIVESRRQDLLALPRPNADAGGRDGEGNG